MGIILIATSCAESQKQSHLYQVLGQFSKWEWLLNDYHVDGNDNVKGKKITEPQDLGYQSVYWGQINIISP